MRQTATFQREIPMTDPSVKAGQVRGPKGGHAAAQTLSASSIAKVLGGIDCPARGDDLVSHAKSNGAPEAVIDAIKDFPEREYQSMADVEKGFGKSH
jgi:hypothetical protein